jgi:uncharacterized repeat protein (TIGR04138 family)
MKDKHFRDTVENIICDDSRFSYDAYEFISKAVAYTVQEISSQKKSSTSNHISGYELLCGIGDFAVQQFGPLAYEVLESWGLKDSLSIGYVVFNMVDYSLLGKSDDDSIKDFENVFNLKKELTIRFLPSDGYKPQEMLPIDLNDLHKV